MNRVLSLMSLAAVVVLVAGCENRRVPDDEHGDEHAGHREDAGAGQGDAGEGFLRVDRGMLGDLRVTARPAEARPAGDSVTVLGELNVNEDAYAEIGSSIPARVARVFAAPGDTVSAGQALLELESPEVGRARAALQTGRARLDLATRAMERRRALAADRIVPRRLLEAAEAEVAEADAEHRAARDELAALGATEGTGSRLVLTSPIEGTVIDRTALLGRRVDSGSSLFVVADLRRLWLVAHAFERDALRVRPGATARVTFPALPGQPVRGTVARVGSRVDPASRTVAVRVEVDNPAGVLRPGMSASVVVPVGDPGEIVVAVPVDAVQRQPQGWCVFLPTAEEGVFEVRAVGRGRDLDGEVEVLTGLRAGERVVVDGAFLLKAEADKTRGGSGEHHH